MNSNRFNYNSNGNMPMYNRIGPYGQNLNEWRNSPNTNQKLVWEPYALAAPRRVLTIDEQKQTQNRKIDEDWFHAYATYSPYRTSNQEYGFQQSPIHFTPNVYHKQPNAYTQVPSDSRQNSMNANTGGLGSPQSPMFDLLTRHGLPPLAYRTPRSSQNT
ncbi:unnamed protein product [Rotaria sordida]|uniref:Uncharacterized protein n=1 Tax=Rotaria sordida TaxID=392033 RepID=A0A814SGM0_9BILA|nr:unnamed protein product [Rotaria sordida]CAF1482147.1 unnamed protein product [Rotaria sordida]